MGKDDSILGAVGDLISAMAGEVDIFSSSSSSPSSPSSSSSPSSAGAGSYSDSSGGSDGYSSDDFLGVTSHVRANNSGHTIKVGNTEYHYDGGMKGYIDALLGGKPVATSVVVGDRISHKDSHGKEVAHSVVASDGTVNTYNNKDTFLGKKTPVPLSLPAHATPPSQSGVGSGGECSGLQNSESSDIESVDIDESETINKELESETVNKEPETEKPCLPVCKVKQYTIYEESELGEKDGISGERRHKFSDLYNRNYQLNRTTYLKRKRYAFRDGFNDAQAKRIPKLGDKSYKAGYEFGSQKLGQGYFDGKKFLKTEETDAGYIADYLTAIIPIIKSIFFKTVDCKAGIDQVNNDIDHLGKIYFPISDAAHEILFYEPLGGEIRSREEEDACFKRSRNWWKENGKKWVVQVIIKTELIKNESLLNKVIDTLPDNIW